jgi:cytochrome c oxidase subunit III
MPRTDVLDDLELIIDDIGRRGGNQPPGRGDGGKGGGRDRERNRPWGTPSPRRYATAIALAMISILMFFMAMSAAFIVLRATSHKWVSFQLPWILWVNTAVLLTSSLTLELARHRLSSGNPAGFRKLWIASTVLGLLFLTGQLFAWRILVAEGVYIASTISSSFFYVITAAHGLHLFGGVCALLFVAFRNFDKTRVTRALAAEVSSYYWHFMDGLWIFLFLLLYFGK